MTISESRIREILDRFWSFTRDDAIAYETQRMEREAKRQAMTLGLARDAKGTLVQAAAHADLHTQLMLAETELVFGGPLPSFEQEVSESGGMRTRWEIAEKVVCLNVPPAPAPCEGIDLFYLFRDNAVHVDPTAFDLALAILDLLEVEDARQAG